MEVNGTIATDPIVPHMGGIAFSWNVSSNPYHNITNYKIHESTSNFPFSDASVIWEGLGVSGVNLEIDKYGPCYYWLSASVGSGQVYFPDTYGILSGPIRLNNDGIQDPEFQIIPNSKAWAYTHIGFGTASLWTFVGCSEYAVGQMGRVTFPTSFNGDPAVLTQRPDYRSIARQGQHFKVEIRWRKTNSIFATNTAAPGSLNPYMYFALYSVNSDGSAGDLPPTGAMYLPLSSYASSLWHLATGVIRASSDSTLPFFQSRFVTEFRGGSVDIDRISMFPVNSSVPNSMMTSA